MWEKKFWSKKVKLILTRLFWLELDKDKIYSFPFCCRSWHSPHDWPGSRQFRIQCPQWKLSRAPPCLWVCPDLTSVCRGPAHLMTTPAASSWRCWSVHSLSRDMNCLHSLITILMISDQFVLNKQARTERNCRDKHKTLHSSLYLFNRWTQA